MCFWLKNESAMFKDTIKSVKQLPNQLHTAICQGLRKHQNQIDENKPDDTFNNVPVKLRHKRNVPNVGCL
jgi:hypothetical protein